MTSVAGSFLFRNNNSEIIFFEIKLKVSFISDSSWSAAGLVRGGTRRCLFETWPTHESLASLHANVAIRPSKRYDCNTTTTIPD